MTLTLAEGTPMTSSADIITGRRPVWALPLNDGCAKAARSILGETLKTLLPGRLDDGLVMVSEIATNAWQHGLDGVDDTRAPAGRFELAIHRRGTGPYAQLVVAVFDPRPDRTAISTPVLSALARLPETPPGEGPPPEVIDHLLKDLRIRQRGLDIVHDLSRGRWGAHRTRSQRGVPGKAVWFALPLHAMSLAYRPPAIDRTPAQTAGELKERLTHRGARHMIGNDLTGGSVLSISRDLTIWCHAHTITWHADGRTYEYPDTDLAEAVERMVETNEELDHIERAPLEQGKEH